MTASSEPTIAIMSAIRAFVMQVAVASSATKDGARNFTRQGFATLDLTDVSGDVMTATLDDQGNVTKYNREGGEEGDILNPVLAPGQGTTGATGAKGAARAKGGKG